jgi:hypothetical protein
MKKLLITFVFCTIIGSLLYAGTKDPVAVLFQVKGNVEYTKNGIKWKKVRRNKFLFVGYQIRSGESGSGIITNRISGKDSILQPNTTLLITDSGLRLKEGKLSKSKRSNALISGLMKRFSRSQSYTTVRRSADQQPDTFDIVRHIIVTDDYPYLVWENLDHKYRYELAVGSDFYLVEPRDDSIVRVKLRPFEDTQTIKIRVFEGNKEVTELQPYKKRGTLTAHTIHWMSKAEKGDFEEAIRTIQKNYPDNDFMLGSLFEREKMWSAAMDQYKMYLEENPDEIEMTPYLFRVYKKLKLKNVYKNELSMWAQAMKE